jgi:hypothetical protein
LIPFLNELVDLCTSMVFGFKIRDTPAFALADTEPLFDLMHPGAMHRCKVHHATWMLGKPGADFLAMVRADVVTHAMNRPDLRVNLPVQRFEKVDELSLALPVITVPVDLARTGVKGRTELEGPGALVRVLVPVRKVLGLGGSECAAVAAGGRSSRPRTRPVHREAAAACRGRSVRTPWQRRRRPAAAWERATDDGARV